MTQIVNTADQRPAALAAVRTVLADHADAAGVHLGAAIWMISTTPGT